MPQSLVSARNLVKEYSRDRRPIRVVDDVSFDILRGETLGLVGESGSGKSTIARLLLRLIEPTGGAVEFDGIDVTRAPAAELRRLRRRMQIVFQDPYAALNPRMRVRDIVAEPFRIHEPALSARERVDRVAALLAEVGLTSDALPRFPHQFSGGQRQRINIARALALRPDLLVLDEPVSALDVSVGAQVINLLRSLQQTRSMTYLFISHSMPLVRYLSTRIAVLRRGRLVELNDAESLCANPQDPYTQQLIAATPELATA
jgi:peptide/nickel transport system ATP-binding protein